MIDDSVARNLDAQSRRIDRLQETCASILEDGKEGPPDPPQVVGPRASMNYESLTRDNDRLRDQEGWGATDLDACLTPELSAKHAAWLASGREPWSPADYAAVGLSGVVGLLASIFDDQLDALVLDTLGQFKDTPLVRRWEKEARGLPIDYTGPRFGGPGHRLRSSGHDFARPFDALRQILEGEFHGIVWSEGVSATVTVGGYQAVGTVEEALCVWLKHLVADFVTPMSLPLPGWTKLYELPWRDVRKFAHDSYSGIGGHRLNARSGLLTPGLSVVTTEAIVRTRVHWNSYERTHRFRLDGPAARRRNEMLLAGHALVGAASLGRTFAAGMAHDVFALRHLNVPVLVRLGAQALAVIRDVRSERSLRPDSWDELAGRVIAPATTDFAVVLGAMSVA